MIAEQIPWDEFRQHKKDESKARRQRNRTNSADILKSEGVPFEVKNDGAHLIVEESIDFWPGTGKWTVRSSQKTGRGVRSLLKQCVRREPYG